MDLGSDITVPEFGNPRSDQSEANTRHGSVELTSGRKRRRQQAPFLGASSLDGSEQITVPPMDTQHRHPRAQNTSGDTDDADENDAAHGQKRVRRQSHNDNDVLRQQQHSETDDGRIIPPEDPPERNLPHKDTTTGQHDHDHDHDHTINTHHQTPTVHPSPTIFRTLFVHQVQCIPPNNSNTQTNTIISSSHTNHPKISTYLDNPSLFPGDSGASALRSRNPISNLENYLDTRPDIGLVIIRQHSCQDYHALYRDQFVRLPRPLDPPIPLEMRAYFFVLPHDSNYDGSSSRVVPPHMQPSVEKSEIILLSKPLERALRALGDLGHPGLVDCHCVENMVPPCLQLWYARGVIHEKLELGGGMVGESDALRVKMLMKYIGERFGAGYEEAEQLFAQGLVTRAHLVKLFRPGEVVVKTDEAGELRGFVTLKGPVQSVDGDMVSLECYTWTYDGIFHREMGRINVAWEGDRDETLPITSLSAYPLRFDPTGKLEEGLRNRGKMFWACRKRCLVGYDIRTASFEMQVSNPRYMVDMGTYRELHDEDNAMRSGGGGGGDGQGDGLSDDGLANQEEPPDDQFLLLLPSKIMAFGLHDKKWQSLLVKHMHPVKWNKKAFAQLVLDPHKKELIEAMVATHVSSNMSTDVGEGKGKGLIILLHGGPGTGKTLTAESVAELTERPLYRVTCGDIGTDPESTERYLESVLYIGSIWKAVLFLDEVDVFLEEREKADLQRTALVSVFLQALESHEGILILASSRVGHFGEAFKSRVQLSLHYPPLDEKGRWQIWSNFFKIIQKPQESADGLLSGGATGLAPNQRVNIKELRDKIDILAKEKLNGRQIRNAITSARQLARFRDEPLGYLHLDQTIRVVVEFERHVERTHGH